MYQFAPISLRPEVRASRTQHGQFQNKLAIAVNKVAEEKEILDMNNKDAKHLFNMMDKFFSYGLFSGDQAYWRFVREFLPKTEHMILKAEWGDVNDRRLSMAWLKDAFNKGTLWFQMASFKTDKKIIGRFYHPNACMMNGGMLEAVTEMMNSIVGVQFAFFSRLHLREEPSMAVVVTTPPAKSANDEKCKQIIELDESNPVVPNNPVPEPNRYELGTNDQEVLLEQVVRARKSRNRLNSNRISFDKDEPESPGTHTSTNDPRRIQESLTDVLKKTISHVAMTHLGENKSFESLLQYDEEQNKHVKDEDPPVEGEEIAGQGDVLQLAMTVFLEQGEKLIKMYNVFDRFAVGVPARRLLAVTLHNIYVMSKTLTHGEKSDSLEGPSTSIYFVHCAIPLDSLDFVDASYDHQQLCFYAKTGTSFIFAEGTTKEPYLSVGTGDKALGKAILATIECAFKNSKRDIPPVLFEDSPHSLILKRYLGKELSLSPSTDIEHLSLVYWKETAAGAQAPRYDHSGFLFWRFNQTNWWRRPQGEFEQCYFLLRQDRKLYIFRDSNMKEGIQIYDLRNCMETLEMDQKKDCQWSFELVFPDGNLQLLSQCKDDLIKWMQLISSCLTCSDGVDASPAMCILTENHITIAQEGSRCVSDGFIRTLVSFPLTEVQEGWVVCGGEALFSAPHCAIVLRIDANYEWFFYRTESELDRMKESLSKYPFKMTEIVNSNQSRDAAIITTVAQRCPELWGKPVTDADVAEVYEN